jgi:hypothetical protein
MLKSCVRNFTAQCVEKKLLLHHGMLRRGLPQDGKCFVSARHVSRYQGNSLSILLDTAIQWVPGALSLEVRRPGREDDHSPPRSAEVKNGGAISPHPNIYSWRGT